MGSNNSKLAPTDIITSREELRLDTSRGENSLLDRIDELETYNKFLVWAVVALHHEIRASRRVSTMNGLCLFFGTDRASSDSCVMLTVEAFGEMPDTSQGLLERQCGRLTESFVVRLERGVTIHKRRFQPSALLTSQLAFLGDLLKKVEHTAGRSAPSSLWRLLA